MNKFQAAFIRALRTVAQAALGAIGATTMLESVDWSVVASTAGLAGIVSLLTSAATDLPEVDDVPEAN
ncbi:holin [Mycobacterium sp.]|uniref:holin n=1 Tax=Mycobacterium sp. TaxID=1785 RepID=UPI003A89DC57